MKLITLKKNYEFRYVFKNGKRYNTKPFGCYFLESKKQIKKFGFVVSKKIGKAVERNLIRRRLKEAVLKILPKLKNYTFVFVANPEIINISFQEIQEIMHRMFVKLQVLDVSLDVGDSE